MKTRVLAAAALTASAFTAQAGGIDRSSQFLGPLFEKGGETGSYVQFSYGHIEPNARADGVDDPLKSFDTPGLAFKTDLTDQISVALILEEPYGADIQYDDDSPFLGGGAGVSSNQISLIGRYKFNDNWSGIIGARALKVDGFIDTFTANPFFGGLPPIPVPALVALNAAPSLPISLEADSDYDFGAVVGVAYERPEIALRIALSYNEAIEAEFEGTQTFFTDVARTAILDQKEVQFGVSFPESINLEFQTGIAEGTLLFGSIRHSKYDGFNLTTPDTTAGVAGTPFAADVDGINFVNFADDSTAYNIGVGRQFSERWSASISISYETDSVTPSTTALAPTSGSRGIAIGARYVGDIATISGGISYVEPGDQLVNSASGVADFDDNDAIAFGFRIGFNF
ncbi:hypothetical protein [uncultured Tateyamaria sp.]|uniref:OmpP1/FadL family transporter n=1 Tax=uncultured Tateyamaria sp. TaxID=455651 RepID=UPI002612D870|nr:hypothetical protein [uncultured Tateyamaria sp.]